MHNIKDNYPKYVISMTPLVTRNDENGITHMHLRNFLMLEDIWIDNRIRIELLDESNSSIPGIKVADSTETDQLSTAKLLQNVEKS